MTRSYAFVLPRFFKGLAGGAETLASSLALALAARGDQVEILTTCAVDNRTWDNHLPPGSEVIDQVKVSRFPVDPREMESWVPKQIKISEGHRLSVDDQLEWMAHSVNSTELYRFIAQHKDRFDLVFFAPYLFGTTFWGSQIAGKRSCIIPCLHDESYAYLEIMHAMFGQARGMMFNAAAEQRLARRLYGPHLGGVVGMGFELERTTKPPPYFKDDFPYLLYLGRKETGKNAQLLVDYFIKFKEIYPEYQSFKLVIAGGGSFSDLHRDHALQRTDLIDLQHLTEAEKQSVLQYATCLCQPSVNESFSIVLMEAWLLKVPALVHADCAVTREHVVQSGGGLYFRTEEDFCGVLTEFLRNAELAQQMGRAGKRYVEREYCWDAVLERFDRTVEAILQQ